MGCGSAGIADIETAGSILHRKLKRKAYWMRHIQVSATIGEFITPQELKNIETANSSQPQSLALKDLFKFEAGESFLLSQQRRTSWKIAIFQYSQNWSRSVNSFYKDNPVATDENIKNRFYQIGLDVKRTFPQIKQLNYQHLTTVLQNLALYFQAVGYTQGMNYHVACLLLCGFPPRQVFQLFVRLSNNKYFMLIRNFTQNFQNVSCCIKVIEQLIDNGQSTSLKEVKQKIEGYGLNLFLFIFSWLLTYFLYSFNLKTSILVWDYIILFSPQWQEIYEVTGNINNNIKFGSGFLNTITLAMKILQSLAVQLCACVDIGQIMEILRHDAIEKYLTEEMIEQLIERCRSQPSIDWLRFKEMSKTCDKQLFDIIQTYQSPSIQNTAYNNFLNSCCYPKRKVEYVPASNFK